MRLLRIKEVCEKTGKSRSAIYEDIQKGCFPKPVSIGKRAVAWHMIQIDEWINTRPVAKNF